MHKVSKSGKKEIIYRNRLQECRIRNVRTYSTRRCLRHIACTNLFQFHLNIWHPEQIKWSSSNSKRESLIFDWNQFFRVSQFWYFRGLHHLFSKIRDCSLHHSVVFFILYSYKNCRIFKFLLGFDIQGGEVTPSRHSPNLSDF